MKKQEKKVSEARDANTRGRETHQLELENKLEQGTASATQQLVNEIAALKLDKARLEDLVTFGKTNEAALTEELVQMKTAADKEGFNYAKLMSSEGEARLMYKEKVKELEEAAMKVEAYRQKALQEISRTSVLDMQIKELEAARSASPKKGKGKKKK